MKKPTLSIGIPAYNEEANIAVLLYALRKQQCTNTELTEIVVVSDGSTDKTVQNARSVVDPRITIIERQNRLGMNATENEILSIVTGDLLVLLNADVLPEQDTMLDALVAPLLRHKTVGLVGGNTVPVRPKTIIEWALNAGHEFKQNLYARLHSGMSLYLCHGRVRAFSRAFYTRLRFPLDCPEDAYSFLKAKELGFGFRFVHKATVCFRSPQTLKEHVSQSVRFLKGQDKMRRHFASDIVNQCYAIPTSTMVRTFVWFWLTHPFSMSLYVLMTLIVRAMYTSTQVDVTHWEVSKSSKQIV